MSVLANPDRPREGRNSLEQWFVPPRTKANPQNQYKVDESFQLFPLSTNLNINGSALFKVHHVFRDNRGDQFGVNEHERNVWFENSEGTGMKIQIIAVPGYDEGSEGLYPLVPDGPRLQTAYPAEVDRAADRRKNYGYGNVGLSQDPNPLLVRVKLDNLTPEMQRRFGLRITVAGKDGTKRSFVTRAVWKEGETAMTGKDGKPVKYARFIDENNPRKEEVNGEEMMGIAMHFPDRNADLAFLSAEFIEKSETEWQEWLDGLKNKANKSTPNVLLT